MSAERREAALYLGRLLDNILDEALLMSQNKGRPRRLRWLKEKAQTLKEQFALDFAEVAKAERQADAVSRR